ncbi:MAG: M13 family peptidase [Acidobacteria bacterium]|nr:M13 family peptidase [Acidobacteriota bacterium]
MKRMIAWCVLAGMAGISTVAAQKPAAPQLVSGIDITAFDKSMRPQDDFFRYVNGAWLDKTPIPADKPSYGSFEVLYDKAQENLRAIVEEAGKSGGAPGSDARKIGDFYASFMDEAKVESLGTTPLFVELAAIDAIKTKSDLARAFAHMYVLGCDTPLAAFSEGDFKDPKNTAAFVYQNGLGLPDRDYYTKDDAKLAEYRTKYVAFLEAMHKLAGLPSTDVAATDIMALETHLAKSQWTNVETRDMVKMYNKVATADLATQFPGFDWAAWTGELKIASAPALIIGQPSYVKAVAAAVNEWPVDRWKPYLKSSLIRGFAPYLPKAFVDARFEFYGKTLSGTPEQRPRWKRAVAALDGNLGEMLGKLYVARHFPARAKARMEQLVANLRLAYKDGIDHLDWMSPETRAQAQQKLAAFRPKIGYPNKWRDYSKVQVVRDDLVGNMMRAQAAEFAFQLAKVGKPIDPEEWGMTPQTINAYYNPVRNEVVFPAAILQPPFFNLAADDAVNYGGIGAVIGHEMGHGFDDQGRRFDGTGTMRDWWTKDDASEYQKRTARLVAQFGAYEVLPGLKVNGELTLGENIGDLTGLVIGYRAYHTSLGGKPAPVIDGLTGDQRYFMGWAQVWRSKERDDALRQQVLSNVHAPAKVRGNGPLGNIPEFYTAFGVKPGDKLYIDPAQRVKIW